MEDFKWRSLLERWSELILASDLGDSLPADVRADHWLGFPPVSDEQLKKAEERLRIELPPSYKEFLKISNGWRRTTFAIDRLFPVGEIDWFRKQNKSWIDAYSGPSMYGPIPEAPDEEYFTYESPEDFRRGHLKETLQISAVDDEVYLLNPQVISRDGEWEACFFANWVPGAHRYRSFKELMQAQYCGVARNEWKQPMGVIGDLPNEFVGSPGTPKRKLKLPRECSAKHAIKDLLDALNNPDMARRLFPKIGKIGIGSELNGVTPELVRWRLAVAELTQRKIAKAVPIFIGMLADERYSVFRRDIADALGKIGGRDAVEALFGMLEDDVNINASGAAMFALKKHAPTRLADALMNLVGRRNIHTNIQPIMLLAELGDVRPIPNLIHTVIESSAHNIDAALMAARLIAGFGMAGFEALRGLVKSNDPSIRLLAVSGLLDTRRPEARDLMSALESDPDPRVREQAAFTLKLLPKRLSSAT